MKCSFCGENMLRGRGVLYAKRDGDILSFCSKKCEINMLRLGRKPQKVRWTRRYIEEKDIRMHGKETGEAKEYVRVTKKKTTKKERYDKRVAKKVAVKADKEKRKATKESAPPKPAAPAEAKQE
jgi:large subunit ribosomal protein L24e